MEPQRIGRMAEQQEADRLATLTGDQVNGKNIGQQERHTNPTNKDLGEEELLNPRIPRRVEKIVAPVRRNVN